MHSLRGRLEIFTLCAPVPAEIPHDAARLSGAGPDVVTALLLTTAVSAALDTARGGMFHCARYVCWDSPLY